jgi:eukaryotic-like serine/threonine-protein kinase
MRPGLLVANRFLVRSLLDRGSMGSVWLAHHVELDMPCALKFIEHSTDALDPDLRRRFTQEAKAAALLRSPHVVQIFDAGTWEETPYLAMELLEGETLSKRLDRLGRLRPGPCVAIAEQVARALTKAHAAGVVHRDLKPANIFLVRDETSELVKVIDFGIAKWSLPSGVEAVTRCGSMLGTPCYMSPEQARDCRVVDHRSDLWSLAVIVFECLTGRLPFESQRLAELFLQIIKDPLPVPSQIAPGLPPAFDAWWFKAANRDPAQRFADAREMVEALGLALGVPTGQSPFTDPTASLPSMTTANRGATPWVDSTANRRRITANQNPPPKRSRPRASRSASSVLAVSMALGTLGGGGAALLSNWQTFSLVRSPAAGLPVAPPPTSAPAAVQPPAPQPLPLVPALPPQSASSSEAVPPAPAQPPSIRGRSATGSVRKTGPSR